MQPTVKAFFDPATWTLTYVVYDKEGGTAAIIDPVLDYDPKAARTTTQSADEVIAFVKSKNLTVQWILETHAHADHLSGAPYLKKQLGGTLGIGDHIKTVQYTFKEIFNAEPEFRTDGSQFDRLFVDGDTFQVGPFEAKVYHTPGHTPACVAYQIADAVFVGDTLFMPDAGTARADFPGGDARTLFRSIRRLLEELPQDARMFVCHDYQPNGRELKFETTVAEQRAKNIHVGDGISEDSFVEMRSARDKTLDMPVLILPSVQINMRAGELPPKEDNGVSYLKLPVNTL